jgi:nucleolar protein 14
MPESQLKRLKASLRNAGVTGQQKPKKAKNRRKETGGNDSRLDRNVALQSIREEFNPFEIKKTKEKHHIVGQTKVRGKEGRPALSKQIGEEHVRSLVRLKVVEKTRTNDTPWSIAQEDITSGDANAQ